MHPSIPLLIASLFYTILVLILFFTKDKIRTVENKIYSWLLFIVIVGIILDIIGIYCHLYLPETSFIRWLIVKLYLVYLLTFIYLITIYIIVMSNKAEMKLVEKNIYGKNYKSIKFLTFLYIGSIFLNFILTFTYYNEGNAVYLSGSNTIFVYSMAAIGILSWIVLVIKNRKVISTSKVIPIIIFIIICIPVILIQLSNPEILVVTSLTAFLVNFMYHTIENPDTRMINELYRNKSLVEKSFEEKSNFLFKMTQEVKKPINNMKGIVNSLKSSDDINELKQGIKLLDANSKQMDFIVNDVLDITTLDAKNIKIVNNRYNVYNLFKDIEKRMQEYAKEEVEFRFNIDENIPYLYGDSIKLKQIIMSVLLNSIKKTKNGFIELSIDAIVKYDVCRLIIEVEDSGIGMSIDKVNDVLVTTSELSVDDINNLEKLDINLKLCQKSLKLLGGNLMIRSEEGKGTEVIITIDQQIYANNTKGELEKYEDILYNSSRILIVSDKEEDLSLIKKIINNDNVLINNSFYGKDAIQKIESGKIYDLIIIEDEMSSMSGLTTMQELKKCENFKIPVVVMLGKNKERIKDHYINDGFNDYILRENMNEEVKRILDKYC